MIAIQMIPKHIDHKRKNSLAKTKKLSRKEKAELTKKRLYASAQEVFAQYGFESASVARITADAEVSVGAFYNYFETRESLLAEIVRSLGQELRRSVAAAIPKDANFFVREKISFKQYFIFLKKHPYYIRILSEAEIFLPDAYNELAENILDGYRHVLRTASRKGEIRPLRGVEVDGVALFLMAARHYYGQSFLSLCDSNGQLPSYVVDMYLRFIQGGLSR